MKAVIQRVEHAEVTVEQQSIASIDKGILVLLGITSGDDERDIEWMVQKITNLRIFEGKNGKLEHSVEDLNGELLLVSQFTLYGKCDKGRRPDFGEAAPIEEAKEVYQKAAKAFRQTGLEVQEGKFQAHMQVELLNDGPLTLILESPDK